MTPKEERRAALMTMPKAVVLKIAVRIVRGLKGDNTAVLTELPGMSMEKLADFIVVNEYGHSD
jgi:hypothetical protein